MEPSVQMHVFASFCCKILDSRTPQDPGNQKISKKSTQLASGKRLHNELERSTMLNGILSTISMVMFNSYVTNYQRVTNIIK